ncbi:MAG TPA: GDSL-type esterase/lipase family protein [Thermoanaerobaculia bacterium]|nr:GDSL-type esterase/lipase family protein [Thermoanaerobaculia bacterium]
MKTAGCEAFALALALLWLPSPRAAAGAAPEPWVLSALALGSAGGVSITPRPATDEAQLDLPSGERVVVRLPHGGRLETAAVIEDGWIAAGSGPVAEPRAGGPPPAPAPTELLLLVAIGGPGREAGLLPPPGGRHGRLRAEPLPLIADGRLAGLVWLEGADRQSLAVRFAGWDGAAWDEPATVSPPGPGSQLGLTAARLADGSWLLAWSAFDGQRDEIVWSRLQEGVWSRPWPVTLQTAGASSTTTEQSPRLPGLGPDITPALAPAGSGALLAWSHFNGSGYQVVTSRFSGGRWSAPAAVGAEGTLYPALAALPSGRVKLLYRSVVPAGWTVHELDENGRSRRQSSVPDTGRAGRQPSPLGAGASAATPDNPVPAGTTSSTPPAAASQTYIAFGDSITFGSFDTQTGPDMGYPGRLAKLISATVVNAGLPGESTAEGVTRIDSVLHTPGATALLLMEGTNDVTARLSNETIVFNLDIMARKAELLGLKAIHATVLPRLPDAVADASNQVTAGLAAGIRDLAWVNSRTLVDPFEVFFELTANVFANDYVGGDDKLHPNAAGYTLLAQTFADVLTGVDRVPPVTGIIIPRNGLDSVLPNAEIEVDLYDFGTGIDLGATKLLLNEQPVAASAIGDSRKLVLRYRSPTPLKGVYLIGIQSQDRANPPNKLSQDLSQFVIVGTVFLPGDINHDGRVDGADLLLLALAFGAHRFDVRYSLAADLNGDGVVDGLDLAILAANFGKTSF